MEKPLRVFVCKRCKKIFTGKKQENPEYCQHCLIGLANGEWKLK